MTETNDAHRTSLTLLQRLRRNEPDAWVRLVGLYRPLVLFWCGRGGVRGPDAEDVSQDVFRVAAQRLPDFRRDRPGDTFRGWLRGITRNTLLAHARAAGRGPAAVGGTTAKLRVQAVPAPAAADPDEDDPASEVAALLRRVLDVVRAEFEPVTWRAFVATAVDGRPAPAVAADLGLSAAAVRQAKSRVLRRVKQELGELAE
jgi:RNA polymerase sigma-70 factor (ECF subfamily)